MTPSLVGWPMNALNRSCLKAYLCKEQKYIKEKKTNEKTNLIF